MRFAGRRTAGFDEVDETRKKREEAEEIRLLYVAATRAKERLVIPWFAAKGGRLDLLARGFIPTASALVEAPDLDSLASTTGDEKKPETKLDLTGQWIDRRHTWEQSRAGLLLRATKPVTRLSPSKLDGEAEPLEDERVGTEREQAMAFGTVVHDTLEVFDLQAPPAQQCKQIEQFIAGSGLRDEDKERAIKMVCGTLGSELLTHVRNAEQVYRELPFAHPMADGLMEGKMDLLFCEDGKWTLVDYKTDARVDVEKYAEQLRAYEVALKQVAGISLARKMLFYLATGTVEQVP